MKTRDLFTRKMKLLCAVFRAEPTIEMLDAYWNAFDELTDAAFVAGTDAALKSCKFMPVPAEIIAFGKVDPLTGFVPSELPEDDR